MSIIYFSIRLSSVSATKLSYSSLFFYHPLSSPFVSSFIINVLVNCYENLMQAFYSKYQKEFIVALHQDYRESFLRLFSLDLLIKLQKTRCSEISFEKVS